MTSKERPEKSEAIAKPGNLGKLLPGGEMGPLNNRNDFEAELNKLPAGQREFVQETARFADLWQYCAEHKIQLPGKVVVEMAGLSKLTQNEQLSVLRELNQNLMECLHDVSEDSGLRQ
jgi:hypothetical protein